MSCQILQGGDVSPPVIQMEFDGDVVEHEHRCVTHCGTFPAHLMHDFNSCRYTGFLAGITAFGVRPCDINYL